MTLSPPSLPLLLGAFTAALTMAAPPAQAVQRAVARSDCPSNRRSLSEVRAAIDVAVQAWSQGELRLFMTASSDAELAVSCLAQHLDPVETRRLHLLSALQAQLENHPRQRDTALDAACQLGLLRTELPPLARGSGASLDDSLRSALIQRFDAGHCTEEAPARGRALPPALSGPLYVDGRGSRYRATPPRRGPYTVQWQSRSEWHTAVVEPGMARLPRYPRLDHVVGAAALASLGATAIFYASKRQADTDVAELRSRAWLTSDESDQYSSVLLSQDVRTATTWTLAGVSVGLVGWWAVLRF